MKKIIMLIFATTLVSCSVHKRDYELMNSVFNDVQKNSDTIDVISYNTKINPDLLNEYTNHKQIYLNKGIFPSEGTFHWTNSSTSWVLKDDDIAFMVKNLKTQKVYFWDAKQFNTNKVINFFESPLIYNECKTIDEERIRRANIKRHLYLFSVPIFNKDRDIAIISYNSLYFLQAGGVLIYKNINKIWTRIGSYH